MTNRILAQATFLLTSFALAGACSTDSNSDSSTNPEGNGDEQGGDMHGDGEHGDGDKHDAGDHGHGDGEEASCMKAEDIPDDATSCLLDLGMGEDTYWKDTDGVDPGTAGCHDEYKSDSCGELKIGRAFGEFCLDEDRLVESNPGAGECHTHTKDFGHPDVVSCSDWCQSTTSNDGKCEGGVEAQGASGTCQSARCVCDDEAGADAGGHDSDDAGGHDSDAGGHDGDAGDHGHGEEASCMKAEDIPADATSCLLDLGTGEDTYWKDTDGVDPGTAGCHDEYMSDSCGELKTGRAFGEFCLDEDRLVESNPGAGECHTHTKDFGHPDVVSCSDWCQSTESKNGKCEGGIEAQGASGTCQSAHCVCD